MRDIVSHVALKLKPYRGRVNVRNDSKALLLGSTGRLATLDHEGVEYEYPQLAANGSLQIGLNNTGPGPAGSFQCGLFNTQTNAGNSIQSGDSNTQSGEYSSQSGYGNEQSGDYATQSGYYNTQSGYYGSQAGNSLDDDGNNYVFMFGHNKTAIVGERVYFATENGIWLEPADAPASPEAGVVYYDSTANKLKFHNGSTWETVTSA